MNVPEDGRIVVIDDQEKEAIPLLKALSQNGYATKYFTEKYEDLPKNPLNGINLVFLDIVLGTDGQESRTKITTAMGIFSKIVSVKNGPLIIVAWTKHEELIQNLSSALETAKYQFIMVNMEKNECKVDDEYSIELINKKLEQNLDGKGALHLFITWQNLVHRASGKIVNDFSQFYTHDTSWNQNMTTVFLQLARGYAGKQLDKTKIDDVIRNALFSFNGAFIDSLNTEIRTNVYSTALNLPFSSAGDNLDEKTTGKINSKLIITDQISGPKIPGTVFENIDVEKPKLSELFDGNFETFTNKAQLEQSVKYVFLEITPICDYAQDKQRVLRILPGVLWPTDISANKIDKRKWYVYPSSIILFQDKLYHMVFDFRYLTSVSMDKLSDKVPIFIVKQELLVDIQANLAGHVNRPGVVSV